MWVIGRRVVGDLVKNEQWRLREMVCVSDRIIKAVDYKGDICGRGAESNNRYGAWPYPLPCSKFGQNAGVEPSDCFKFKICLSDCTQTATDPRMVVKYNSVACKSII